jgi:hypothetical protein
MHVRLRHAMPYLAVIMRTSYAGMTKIPVLMTHVILYKGVYMKISVEDKSVTKITFDKNRQGQKWLCLFFENCKCLLQSKVVNDS